MPVLRLPYPRLLRIPPSAVVSLGLVTDAGTVSAVSSASLSVLVDGAVVASPSVTISSGVASATIPESVATGRDLGTPILCRWTADGSVYDVVYTLAAASLTCPVTAAEVGLYLPQFAQAARLDDHVAAAWQEVAETVSEIWQVIELRGAAAAVKYLAAALVYEGAGLEYLAQAGHYRHLYLDALQRMQAVRASDSARAVVDPPASVVRSGRRWGMPRI